MSTRTPWRPEAKEPPVRKTPEEVLDQPPRRWSVPLLVLVAVLLGMGAGAWIAGNNERALDLTAQRLDEVSAQLETARSELATAEDDLTAAQDELAGLRDLERLALKARRGQEAAMEDLEQAVVASAELFDTLPAGSTAGLPADPEDWAVIERNVATANAGDETGYRATFTPGGRITLIAAGLRNELQGDEIASMLSPRPHLRFVGAPAQAGRFVWGRYHESASSGVSVNRLQGGRILHQWIVVRTW